LGSEEMCATMSNFTKKLCIVMNEVLVRTTPTIGNENLGSSKIRSIVTLNLAHCMSTTKAKRTIDYSSRIVKRMSLMRDAFAKIKATK
jgi:hypothetical protein